MNPTCLFASLLFLVPPCAYAGGKAMALEPPAPLQETGPQWTLSAGGFYRTYGDLKMSGNSRSPALRMPSLTGKGHNSPLRVPAGAMDDKTYEDGFVRPDSATQSDGSTWNWGYQNDSQLSGDQVHFQSNGMASETTSSRQTSALSSEEEPDAAGVFLGLGVQWQTRNAWRISLEGTFSWSAFDAASAGSTFQATDRRTDESLRLEDSYQLDGIVPPQAPYQGSREGPGPLIEGTPQRQLSRHTTFTDRADLQNEVRRVLDINHFTLSLGGSVGRAWQRIQVRLGAGPAVHFLSWDASQTERLLVTRSGGQSALREWSDDASGVKVIPGFYLTGATTVQINPRLSVEVFARHDWAGKFHAAAGSAKFDLALDGWAVGGGVVWRF